MLTFVLNKLVVAIDGSSCAAHAFELAQTLALRGVSSIAVCCAVEDSGNAESMRTAQTILNDALAHAKTIGLTCAGDVVYGPPAGAILSYAKAKAADAIVIGTHGRGGLNRLLMGSVAEAVLRRSPLPVIVVRQEARLRAPGANDPIRVLVPIDGSECATKALDTAIALAEQAHAELILCYVVDIVRAAEWTAGQEQLIGASLDALEEEGRREINAGIARAPGRIRTSSCVVQGIPADKIQELIQDLHPTLIVIGTHGRTGVGRFVIGSVAESVIRNADVPAIVVPLGHERKTADVGEKTLHGASR